MRKKNVAALAVAVAAALAYSSVFADPAMPNISSERAPSGVLSLSAQASEEVAQDVVDITLFFEQQAKDAASLTNALNRRTAAALKAARSASDVSVHTGTFSIFPSTDHDGRISGWRGRTEIVLESHDFSAASELAAQLNSTMQVANVSFSLSPEAQRRAADKLAGEAIAQFRQQAEAAAHAFGYTGYIVRSVNVGREAPPRPLFAMRAMAAGSAPAAPLPIEGGKARVTVNVSGSVQMTR